MFSSFSTVSPTALSHFRIVPSAILSPIWGMTMSIFAMSLTTSWQVAE